MAVALSNKAIKKMSEIIKATADGSYVYTSEDIWGGLVKNGYAITNPEIVNDAGELATQATGLGIEQFSSKEEKPMVFIIEDVPVAAPRARSGASALYPFNDLGIGQSFFVPATTEKPEPWKTMASSVGSATKRFAEGYENEDGTAAMRAITRGPKKGEMVKATKNTRVFAISKDNKDGVDGARIGRTS